MSMLKEQEEQYAKLKDRTQEKDRLILNLEADVSRIENELSKQKKKVEDVKSEYEDLKEIRDKEESELLKLRWEKKESERQKEVKSFNLEGEVEQQ